jgi:hypothetical protein
MSEKPPHEQSPQMQKSQVPKGETGHWYSMDAISEMSKAGVEHVEPRGVTDRLARADVAAMRYMIDTFSGYRTPFPWRMQQELRAKNWISKSILLETVGTPLLFSASVVRYWRAMASMRQDKGWVHSLLNDAENERMHLTTWFMVERPSIFMRAAVLAQQTLYVPMFAAMYAVSPRFLYRVLGYLEETAITHYTLMLREIAREGSELSAWKYVPAPNVAREYWNMGENGTLADAVAAILRDEEHHRDTYHTLANKYYRLKNDTFPDAPAAF